MLLATAGCRGGPERVEFTDTWMKDRELAPPEPIPLRLGVAPIPTPMFDVGGARTSQYQIQQNLLRGGYRTAPVWSADLNPEAFRELLVKVLRQQQVFENVTPFGTPDKHSTGQNGVLAPDLERKVLDAAQDAGGLDVMAFVQFDRYETRFLKLNDRHAWSNFMAFMFGIGHWWVADETYRSELTVKLELWSVHTSTLLGSYDVTAAFERELTDNERGSVWDWHGLQQPPAILTQSDMWEKIVEKTMPEARQRFWKNLVLKLYGAAPDDPGAPAPAPGLVTFREYMQDPGSDYAEKVRKRLALVVGVSQYQKFADNESLANYRLQYAHLDALKLGEYLQDPAGGQFNPKYVRVLTNGLATRDAFRRALNGYDVEDADGRVVESVGGYIGDKILPGDTVLVYWAGHGLTRMDGGSPRRYLVPYDGDPETLANCVALDELYQELRGLGAGEAILVVDGAFESDQPQGRSLTATYGQRTPPDPDATPPEPPTLEQVDAASTVLQVVSTTAGEGALEFTEVQHGIYTHFLLQSVSPKSEGEDPPGDADKDGTVTLAEALKYADDKVRDLAVATGRAQHPERSVVWTGGVVGVDSEDGAPEPLVELRQQLRAAVEERLARIKIRPPRAGTEPGAEPGPVEESQPE